MKKEKCPLCGATLIEEVHEVGRENCGSGSTSYEGSIDILPSGSISTRSKRSVYRCPNPECGYLTVDC
jgi:hypothetical protein